MKPKILTTLFLIIAVAAGLIYYTNSDNPSEELTNKKSQEATEISSNNSGFTEDDLEQGCFARDCIPSIQDPKFDSASEADEWLNDDDLIFGIVIDGQARAYPQRILNWHEIVNDTINDTDFAVTFCPLCGSAISFERTVNDQTTTFGVSGKLFNSNLVMYDRLEESYWQQETGEAIVGKAADRGDKLKTIPMASSFWSDWKQANPETEVLSRDTGYSRNYDRYPYGAYEEDGELYFGIENTDTRLQIKTPGYGFEIPDYGHKFYQESDLPFNSIIDDTLEKKVDVSDKLVNPEASNQISVSVTNKNGIVIMTLEDGSEIIPIRTFWFAFAAFHPESLIYEPAQ